MPCNPKNKKAQDDNYECNQRTNRWIKKRHITKTHVEKTSDCNPKNPKSQDPNYECNPRTNRWIKKKTVTNKTKQKTVSDQKTKQKTWQKTCKQMEEKCPMQTDLSGDNWCSLQPKNVFYYEKNGKRFCYGVDEIFSIIHLGFTSRDTSYEVPPLRLQLPRDSYDRSPFTKDFFITFKQHTQKYRQLPKDPEVAYFLKHMNEFYSPTIQEYMHQLEPNKVRLSDAIDRFLMKHHDIDINLETSTWYWLPGKRPVNLYSYVYNST